MKTERVLEVELSCWVAPTIASEIWGLPLADIWLLIRDGSLPTHHSGGFSFVRLPHSSPTGRRLAVADRPPTYTSASTKYELADAFPSAGEPQPKAKDIDENESEFGPPPDEDPNDNRITDWRVGRRESATRRRPPGSN